MYIYIIQNQEHYEQFCSLCVYSNLIIIIANQKYQSLNGNVRLKTGTNGKLWSVWYELPIFWNINCSQLRCVANRYICQVSKVLNKIKIYCYCVTFLLEMSICLTYVIYRHCTNSYCRLRKCYDLLLCTKEVWCCLIS